MQKPLTNKQIQKIIKENQILKRQLIQKTKIERELIENNYNLKNFSSIICHELKQPLSSTSNYIRVLKRQYSDKLDENAHQFIQSAISCLEDMSEIIKTTLEASNLSKSLKNLKDVDLNILMSVISNNLYDLISTSNAVIKYDKLPIIKSDYIYMLQIFINLITNSIKYRSNDREPLIYISVKQKKMTGYFQLKIMVLGLIQNILMIYFVCLKN